MATSDAHNHGAGALRAGARYQRRLMWSFLLILTFFLVEVVGGILTNSLALLSDAGHMLTDVVGLGMALAAIHLANRAEKGGRRTFGLYRLEILAALANTILLFGVAIYVLYEAIRRFSEPPEVPGIPLLVVATAGLLVNLGAFFLLRSGSKESLNVQGAYLEVLADMIGSIGVIIAAIILATTGWQYADPLFGAGIGLFILPRAWRLGSQAFRVLIEAAPPEIDLTAVKADLVALPGVVDVHDLHIWTLTSDMEMATAHVMVAQSADMHAVLDEAREILHERYNVVHATLQVEPDDHTGCDEVSW